MMKALITRFVRFGAPRQLLKSRAVEPARPARQSAGIERSPEHHAERLLHWLLEQQESTALFYPEVHILYHRTTRKLNWAPRAWNPVARHLTKLLGGRKTYVWTAAVDGSRHRLRVYLLPNRCDPGGPQGARTIANIEPRKEAA
jgi:hypothetical protein